MPSKTSLPVAATWALLFALTALSGPAVAEGRARIWDLSPLVAASADWATERDWVLARLETIGTLADRPIESSADLTDALDATYELQSRATRLAIYGFLSTYEDQTSEEAARRYDVGTALEHRALAATAFLDDQVLRIDERTLHRWMTEEPGLDRHRRRLNRILREGPHTLSPESEAILESAARWPRLAADLFGALHGSDLGWSQIDLPGGETARADRSTFLRYRDAADRATRGATRRALLEHLERLETVFGLLYTRRIEADVTIARHRGFDDAMEAIWFLREGMPPGTPRVMIDVARSNLGSLHRFLRLRARALGLERLSPADLFAPAPGLPADIPMERAIETAVAALEPVGPDFAAQLRANLARPWTHLEDTPHRGRSYAIWPSVAGSPPYFHLSYEGSQDDCRRVAGGLALQAAFSSTPPELTPSTREDPGIYSNGVIYAGDILHDALLVERADGDRQRIAVLVHSLDLFWQHFFRWILVVELDTEVQRRVLEGNPPSGAEISSLYLDLLRLYLGADRGLVELEPHEGAEWMTYSVPFLSFEHQFWPPAVAMGATVAGAVLGRDERIRDRFWRVLGRGELDRTHQLLEPLGIDLTSPAPYENVIRRMDSLLDRLEAALDGR